MKSKLIISLLILSLVAVPLFATACGEEEEVTPPAQEEEEEEGPPPGEEEEANWWDKFGEPEYGGTITVRTSRISSGSFDPASSPVPGILGAGGMACNVWGEGLAFCDWTLDRSEWPFTGSFTPLQYFQGLLAESWEQIDPLTIIIHLRQGVYWQNRPPVDGRELTADDIVFNFDRLLGTGNGYTERNPLYNALYSSFEKAVATGKYTVEFQLNQPGIASMFQLLGSWYFFVPPEWVEQADPTDPLGVIGTSPWVLTEFVEGSKMVYSRNPDYWGYDERYPQNKLPYADTLVQLAIPDIATALAAMRSGQVDMWTDPMGALPWQQLASLTETNPEIQYAMQPRPCAALFLRCDTKPFTDINVRKALNMAIDRQTIAETYYGGYSDGNPCGQIGPSLEGWAASYDDWPQELKDEYSYNPERARQLLAEAAQDGIFEANEYGGFDTNAIAASNQDITLLELVQSLLNDIGVVMEINVMDPPSYSAFISAGSQDQMVYNDGYTGLLGSPAVTLSYLTTATIPQTNYTFNYDTDFDALYNQVLTASNSDEMKRLSAEADLYIIKHHWMVPILPSYSQVVVWQPWVKGYSGEILWEGVWAGALRARLWIDSSLER